MVHFGRNLVLKTALIYADQNSVETVEMDLLFHHPFALLQNKLFPQ